MHFKDDAHLLQRGSNQGLKHCKAVDTFALFGVAVDALRYPAGHNTILYHADHKTQMRVFPGHPTAPASERERARQCEVYAGPRAEQEQERERKREAF